MCGVHWPLVKAILVGVLVVLPGCKTPLLTRKPGRLLRAPFESAFGDVGRKYAVSVDVFGGWGSEYAEAQQRLIVLGEDGVDA